MGCLCKTLSEISFRRRTRRFRKQSLPRSLGRQAAATKQVVAAFLCRDDGSGTYARRPSHSSGKTLSLASKIYCSNMGVPWGCLPPQTAIEKCGARSIETTDFPRAPAIYKAWRSILISTPAAEVLLLRDASPTCWQPKIEDKRVAKICQTDGSLDPGRTRRITGRTSLTASLS